ncbi:MAG TPA: tyrosine-type recombinase/integrase [Acidobacteriota bacterium]|nr:tyrosine-type recombinase/integrase [Acidobacteriota bacterium]
MSVYSVKGKGWRYDFTHDGQRYTEAWFKTKRKALDAESEKRKELDRPRKEKKAEQENVETGITFLEMVEKRLDYLKEWTTRSHYQDNRYRARAWVKLWGRLPADTIDTPMIEQFLRKRRKQVSAATANAELKYLKALFNYGVERKLIRVNPTDDLRRYPVDRKRKYIPPLKDIEKVIAVADPDSRDYLWVIQDTLARVGEIDRLTWEDVDFERQSVILYTRKRRHRGLTPREVPMTRRVFEVLSRRFQQRDSEKPWVFWHRYWSRKEGRFLETPYRKRNKLMHRLCKRAGVRHFSFHALRHAGAAILEQSNVPVRTVQQILGHENISTTQIYLRSLSGTERRAMEIFESVLQKSHTESHTDETTAPIEPVNDYVN